MVPSSISEPRAAVPRMRQARGRIRAIMMPSRRKLAVKSCGSSASPSWKMTARPTGITASRRMRRNGADR